MKKTINTLIVIVFALVNAFSFIGCKEVAAESETVACWVASIGNLDFPSKQGLSADALAGEIDDIVYNCKKMGINTIFFQVRPNGDALYCSDIFPWSVYLSGTQGGAPDMQFDPLEYFVDKAHAENIALHAWINPYRIGSGESVWSSLSKENPAVLHKEYTVTTPAGVYYDPGLPDVRRLIIRGVSEIVKNYDVDGIHFDDYFYPYDLTGFDDSAAYQKYGENLSLEDFRRQSVDELVKNVYKTIKTIDSETEFGISPFGIWANKDVDPTGSETRGMSSYSEIFSDSKKWVEEGWLDYICPQIYWSFDHEAAPYGTLVDWWTSLCSKNKMKLYIGLALYKMGTDEIGWDDPALIKKQIDYAKGKKAYAGYCYFRYQTLLENPLNCLDKVLKSTVSDVRDKEALEKVQKTIILPPAVNLKVTYPETGVTVQSANISVAGSTKAGSKVYVNGIEAVVSSKGLFAAYVPLNFGKNNIQVISAGQAKTLTVNRSMPVAPNESLVADSFYPSGEVSRNVGDTIRFEIKGPEKATVVLQNGIVKIPMNEDKPGLYRAEWTIPDISGDKLDLNSFECIATRGGVEQSIAVDFSLSIYEAGYTEEYILQKEAYLFDKSDGGSQMDHAPLPKGYRLRTVGREGTRSLLENGYWIENDTLGTEIAEPLEPRSYDYKTVTIPIEAGTVLSHEVIENKLRLSIGEGHICLTTDEYDPELDVKVENGAVNSDVWVRSAAGYEIAGYEIYPQKYQLTVCLHFKTGSLSGKKILLDPGHGGEDRGALSAGGTDYPSESMMNLALALQLKEFLEKEGAEVLLLRNNDIAVALDRRVEIAIEDSVDLYISLHHNSAALTGNYAAASGGSVHYSSPVAKPFADAIAKNLWKGLRDQAEVRVVRQSLRVCRQTRYPAILIEAGYVCNPLEYEHLCQTDTRKTLCMNIIEGLKTYFES